MIEDLKKDKLQKDKRKMALLSLLTLVVVGAGLLHFSGFNVSLTELTSRNVDFDQKVVISDSISPFRTDINSTETIKFTNERENEVKLTFQTAKINRSMEIAPGGAAYFQASKYSDLPQVNYFNLESGVSGQIVVSS